MKRHALVLGGSMGGLLAARVLSDTYSTVTIVDRDTMPAIGENRRGVPQGRHLHGLLARGQQVMEELFPGLTADLQATGVPVGDLLGNVRWTAGGHRLRQMPIGLPVVCVRRPVLEGHIRARVLQLPNVSLVERCDVVGLATADGGERVVGAHLARRDSDAGTETMAADLVIDATGRGSRLPAWLESIGYEPPAEDRIRVGVGYATRMYRLPDGVLGDDFVVTNAASLDNERGGIVELLGDGTAMVTLIGRLGDDPPADLDGFVSFARTLKFPDIHDAIVDGEPLDDGVTFKFPANVRRRYERLARLPKGILPIGDSICSFNPVYAQGMTVCGLGALTLRSEVAAVDEPSARRFLARIARVVDAPWNIAAGGDLAFPGVEGKRTRKGELIGRYVARVQAAGATDPVVAAAFVRVAGLVDPPQRLLRPAIARRVWLAERRPGVGRPSARFPQAATTGS